MHDKNKDSQIFLWAPIIFVCHVLEEAPGFVEWANTHLVRDITINDFWRVNLSGLIITTAVIVLVWLSRSGFAVVIAMAWLSFLMLANALLHIAGSFVDNGYVPGLVTAVCLYLPYYSWLAIRAVKNWRIQMAPMVATALLGSLPMLLHGYLILFRGSRLF
jgi:hypothetical protein